MVTAFCAGDGKKPYATKQQAYYAIAKELVVAKYPAWLNDENTAMWTDGDEWLDGWTTELAISRGQKQRKLFFEKNVMSLGVPYSGHPAEGQFDEKKWMAFVRRVARYLEYVDNRDDNDATSLETPTLEDRYQYAENKSVEWGELALKYQAELRRRNEDPR